MIDSLILPFKHWSEKGSVYIISDTHFNDHDCKIMDANWPEPDELVANINKVVHKQDTLIILGDIGDCSYVKKLRAGYKILLLGNHDAGASAYTEFFDEIYKEKLTITPEIIISHVPFLDPENRWFNIHGHNHAGKSMYEGNGLNVAANVCNYTPVSLSKIIKSGALKNIKSITRTAIDSAIERKNKKEDH